MIRRDFIKTNGLVCLSAILGVFPGCSLPYEYSPYDNEVKSKFRNLTAKNLDKIKIINNNEAFKFAFITDTHTFYDEFNNAVTALNKRDDIDFVIHGGDLTLSALHKEFTWFNEIIAKLNVPFFTVIGNHDYLSNGERLYHTSFGENNYTFTYKGCKFVMFDNIVWERKNTDPDFDWFNENLKNDGSADLVIPVSHIPPYSDQYDGEDSILNQILENNNIKLSIHGHTHSFYHGKKYGKTDFLVGGDIADNHYQVITIDNGNYSIENIAF
ncbi:metallophosphoesterase family protein [Labilibaculum euxinus]|uniref:Metallophosphoesterase n=1 Tax=Labilibaculum euxinus TaxID=2686357 RepID=A0A7M4D3C2_9BACT|nr:metallophosphoesterase [Labilibaculum euxinus]MUP37151.1 metallophosphoesterase [Labilibaculum euxinus]MVB06356.1 metallophosphoesterase [Labilibaculum euxinus]